MSLTTETCPYCKNPTCEADWTDVGVGYIQTSPYVCHDCGAFEIGPHDNRTPEPEEKTTGWYKPTSTRTTPLPDTISSIDGKVLTPEQAQALYVLGLTPSTQFHLRSAL